MNGGHPVPAGPRADRPPSRFELPQHCSPDRRRAREATLALVRADYVLHHDALSGSPEGDFSLPPLLRDLPPRDDVTLPQKVRIQWWRYVARANQARHRLTRVFRGRPRSSSWYRSLYGGLARQPTFAPRWDDDLAFAQQRLTGVNPMELRRCEASPGPDLKDAANAVLRDQRAPFDLRGAIRQGLAFLTRYPLCWHPRPQGSARSRRNLLAAPTCLFWSDEGVLRPLAIQLKPPEVTEDNPVFTPLSPWWSWMLAKAHAAAADGHYHEGMRHLADTHIVNELIALCTRRELHPDHPVHQLLAPHLEGTLAINTRSRRNLLSVGGPVDAAFAAGVGGVLDILRLHLSGVDPVTHRPLPPSDRYDWSRSGVEADLGARGLLQSCTSRALGPGLSDYHYGTDALELDDAIHTYVERIMGLWYATDADLAEDPELTAWLRRLADAIPGFTVPATVADLVKHLAQIVFNCGPQHAAVNNGQYDAYGFVPNAPGAVHVWPVHDDPTASEAHFWRAMPRLGPALAQMSMVRVLSLPTTNTLMHAGRSPAFEPALNPAAADAVRAFRARLGLISHEIEHRNAGIRQPYTYLLPRNIACSTNL